MIIPSQWFIVSYKDKCSVRLMAYDSHHARDKAIDYNKSGIESIKPISEFIKKEPF